MTWSNIDFQQKYKQKIRKETSSVVEMSIRVNGHEKNSNTNYLVNEYWIFPLRKRLFISLLLQFIEWKIWMSWMCWLKITWQNVRDSSKRILEHNCEIIDKLFACEQNIKETVFYWRKPEQDEASRIFK